ncbi:hypothetical protein DAPPUDRAFT_120843 [Daphnia pulex]|uniref:Uncharacterized protein n=1 Tax=Daphnia pulex TaxID=6669 RepID=E9I2B6_DAPPU|nr:hypothetical protein DAPPUDRAFT_120843 [Daphnia pulex]|eukprot:EFX61864.1 hypothetical protein DAPPUDRAFT_120843 [Daphnia pulex]
MDENDNTTFLKSGTQMEQLSYNSTATSGLHCNRMLLQWFNPSSSHLSPFGCNKALPKSELNHLANWFLNDKSPVARMFSETLVGHFVPIRSRRRLLVVTFLTMKIKRYNKTSSMLVVTLLQPNGERCDEDGLNH